MEPTLVTWVLVGFGCITMGALRDCTYCWESFVYWGALALAYSALRVGGIEF